MRGGKSDLNPRQYFWAKKNSHNFHRRPNFIPVTSLSKMDRDAAGMHGSELELLPSNSYASVPQSEPDPRSSSPARSSPIQKGWPDQPRRLQSNARRNKLSTAISCIVAFIPFIFLGKFTLSLESVLSSVSTIHGLISASGLASLVIAINGYEVNDRGNAVVQATRLGPTVFPIVFAAIVGSLMRSYALWRAQNGATLGVSRDYCHRTGSESSPKVFNIAYRATEWQYQLRGDYRASNCSSSTPSAHDTHPRALGNVTAWWAGCAQNDFRGGIKCAR